MAAALPFIDDFLPIHNLHSLSTLAEHLAAFELIVKDDYETAGL